MREIVYTSQFKRDYKKRQHESSLDELMEAVLDSLIADVPLPPKLRALLLRSPVFAECRKILFGR